MLLMYKQGLLLRNFRMWYKNELHKSSEISRIQKYQKHLTLYLQILTQLINQLGFGNRYAHDFVIAFCIN